MKTTKSVLNLALATGVCLAVASSATATIVYDMPIGLAGNDLNGNSYAYYEVGNEFTVNTAGYVTAVGMFDYNKDGFSASIPVAIFQYSGTGWSQVPGTYHVFSGSPGTYVDSAAMYTLGSAVLLTPGVYAIVAGGGGTTADPYWNSTQPNPGTLSPTFDNFGGALSQNNHASWALLGASDITLSGWPTAGGTYTSPYGAGTFDFTPVPETSQFAIAGCGLLGLVYVGRWAWQRRKAVP